MDTAKILTAGSQSVPPSVLTNITLDTLVFDDPATTVVPDTANSNISVVESGFYLVTFDALVIGTGQHQLFLLGNGFAPTGTELLDFGGDAGGVIHGRTVILKADARAFFRLAALHTGGANRDYTCSLCVAKLASD
jgi:hypothetical protein